MTQQTTMAQMSAVELLEHFRTKRLSPVEVTQDALARIERFNPLVNAYCYTDPQGALDTARASEKRWLKGQPNGALDGVPTSIKELTATRGMPTRKASLVIPGDGPWEVDAPITTFLRDAGAVILGKTTSPEFGWKGVTDSPLYGITRNPWDTRMTSGGSSGGAAVAASLNLGVLHQGSDAGGSIRIPSSFTGTFGFKPTFGYIPQWPASATTLVSHLGPMTRTVDDAVLFLQTVARPDPRDGLLGAPRHTPWLAQSTDLRGLRIAFSADFGYVTVDPQVARTVAQAVEHLALLGAHIEAADPGFSDPLELFKTVVYAGARDLATQLSSEQKGLLDPGLLRFTEQCQHTTLTHFTAAQEARAALVARMSEFHSRYDLLVCPMMPITAFEAGHDVPPGSGLEDWMKWSPFSYPFNLTQQPAASLPCGFSSAGLPIGLQVVGARFADDQVLRVCRAYEQAFPSTHPLAPLVKNTEEQ
ncbi:amidase [Pseudomonas fluorescens]|jgi:aspartyl-tRNA(Asn)/glutamyl-tRNA(Gln) amidotransferase subunit A|uniref:amidase n=1 Tax=Pseudomonas TaxID=286 RepID=UPI00071719E9|nr:MULTISPECIES: amidase [Pseudomonas]AYG08380.1 amidase [Pseudomonas fluorescens]MDZ4303195.1 amidase [Pseudomonas sp.]MBJ2239798.1 amidase [Pseudomonas sp. MF6768]MBJ2252135.1 amidase [Pseudomonas sp. MF6784]MBJ2260657.1 amidase [Pseudomonas sp. MF6787]